MTSTDSGRSNAAIDETTVFDSPVVERLVSHWETLRQGRVAPKRGEVDPLDLFEFLPNISMIKVINGGADFEFSLIGTGLAKLYGLVTRQIVSQVECAPETRDALLDALKLCVESKKPVHGLWDKARTAKLVEINLEVAFVPISEDGNEISRILGYHAVLD
ncbi:PAS domain-containing protein [Nisaea denitrificans]|uniref:PAS domain-containing protein n=1 Tax=Nisaea denitrificans TaxID=390877 RepID=UPI000409AE24|nr:PAS domain-containing protein [Nisaea denitrificans]